MLAIIPYSGILQGLRNFLTLEGIEKINGNSRLVEYFISLYLKNQW